VKTTFCGINLNESLFDASFNLLISDMLSNVVEAEDEDNLSIGSANSTSDQK
jgi:hypothetical protein